MTACTVCLSDVNLNLSATAIRDSTQYTLARPARRIDPMSVPNSFLTLKNECSTALLSASGCPCFAAPFSLLPFYANSNFCPSQQIRTLSACSINAFASTSWIQPANLNIAISHLPDKLASGRACSYPSRNPTNLPYPLLTADSSNPKDDPTPIEDIANIAVSLPVAVHVVVHRQRIMF